LQYENDATARFSGRNAKQAAFAAFSHILGNNSGNDRVSSGIPNCLSPVPKAVIVVCGPPKCLHQLFQAIRRSMEALAGINFFDFDDATAPPTQWPDRVNAVSPIANEPILNSLRHSMPPRLRFDIGEVGSRLNEYAAGARGRDLYLTEFAAQVRVVAIR